MASALCHELHDDNCTPDDESDDIVVGWLVMELYDVSRVPLFMSCATAL